MTFESVSAIAPVVAMLIFATLFAVAIAYALWPGNRDRFKRAAESPLNDDERLEE
jgi:cytochrome c oxidase cbb3-type subunit 4